MSYILKIIVQERHIKVELFAAGERERAKMAAKPPIFASLYEIPISGVSQIHEIT